MPTVRHQRHTPSRRPILATRPAARLSAARGRPLAAPGGIGWIKGERRNYVDAVLTDHNPSMRYGIDTIQQISRMLWNRLGS